MMTAPQATAAQGEAPDSKRLVHEIDAYDLTGFLAEAAAFGTHRYGYVVTPNVDNFISLYENASFRALYAEATYVLLDSRVAAAAFRLLRGIRIPVCTGSDLTSSLLSEVIAPDDKVVLIGCSPEQADFLRKRYGLRQLLHHEPPMGFIENPAEVEACLRFVEAAAPFRFCLIAIGNPQGVVIAQRLGARKRARGLALAIGASVDFLTGRQRRAPVWMQRAGLEWLYRLLSNPRRLASRYLIRGPRFFAHLAKCEVVVRSGGGRGR